MDRIHIAALLGWVGLDAQRQQTIIRYVKANQISVALLVFFIFMSFRSIINKNREAAKKGVKREYLDAPNFPEIERLENFDWTRENPIKFRNFKPKYYLTMAIQNLDPSELLTMDRTYAERLKYRTSILKEAGDIAIGINDDARIRSAVIELYTYLLGTYLPKRYPQMFKLHFASFETGDQFMLENLVTRQIFPTTPGKVTNTETLLRTLGVTVDEDFLFLLPESKAESEDPKYVLQAFVCVCPSGWDPRQKLGKRLAAVHEPVPGYADKLEGSMDRYFRNLEVGQYVKRSNWSITQHEKLFMPDPESNHGKEGQEQRAVTEIDPDKTFLRCERQTLHKLPQSKAAVFAFKTYMDTLRDVKLEGLGEELAEAIDGLKSGNVPAMNFYKRGTVWGEAAKEFLRS